MQLRGDLAQLGAIGASPNQSGQGFDGVAGFVQLEQLLVLLIGAGVEPALTDAEGAQIVDVQAVFVMFHIVSLSKRRVFGFYDLIIATY